ncbi:MAG: acyl-CoA dehydrogenase C-terminal domain-containing protein [Pseudomonadales bacterium]|jgi:alkylation response protein AidB-like acyl-CoA dehydrogenase|nr:acyl-CoA dehydrogenase C-terminal domain-containing protein [Pseudomonadales bacterium]MDP6470730.1 acyl-CoA dehydrogenase C-terminal domain-containing protein [Pseudomonadales bacterium]MDP6828318.1 acyl-CoA dehydrogenase C-terminal domain-containing protein [Pseudomonadales bacterium]MDP6972132.1 acyl-CoA dehydrogenase C-terminal domain-containing protein [Pseudomonadales bacterium]
MPINTRNARFLIHDVFDFPAHYAALEMANAPEADLLDAILEEAARFSENELRPLNQIGDQQGCRLQEGEVITPQGFAEAYAAYVEGGWPSLIGAARYGGQELPESVALFVEDMTCTANLAWSMYSGLSRGVQEALTAHGGERQKQDFLPPLISGAWTGTMCLTESHAGSDVGLVRTKAQANADGTYVITGTKIFISAGEHDLAENIVHLVLARIDGSPDGTRGISMFVVPKIDLDGTPNNVVCSALEDKMGIHGNATCVMNFDGARGYLVGEPDAGMSYMFTMMNAARLVVGLQGVCLAQASHELAATYAQERVQMRSLNGPSRPDLPADPILVHPDVRRMLLTQKAFVEGGRALVYHVGQLLEIAEHASDDEQRRLADEEADFLTPIVKGFLTEVCFEAVNHGVQIFGGHGYISETGVEQHVRDARITLIYEGTTQIQGLDLLGRKVLMTQGVGLMHVLGRMNALAQELAAHADADLGRFGGQLSTLGEEWATLSMELGSRAGKDANEIGAAAVDYLFYSGYIVLGYLWARMALVACASEVMEAGAKATCRFYFERLLPRIAAHKAAIEAGAGSLMDVSDEAITSGYGA